MGLLKTANLDLNLENLNIFWARKYLHFLGKQVGALFSNFGCASN